MRPVAVSKLTCSHGTAFLSRVKMLTIHRPINFKLALLAAKDAMDPRTYTDFKKKMEHAYADTTKE